MHTCQVIKKLPFWGVFTKYQQGSLALAWALRRHGTTNAIIVLVTPDNISQTTRKELEVGLVFLSVSYSDMASHLWPEDVRSNHRGATHDQPWSYQSRDHESRWPSIHIHQVRIMATDPVSKNSIPRFRYSPTSLTRRTLWRRSTVRRSTWDRISRLFQHRPDGTRAWSANLSSALRDRTEWRFVRRRRSRIAEHVLPSLSPAFVRL